jgi:hypothetical protein
MAGGGGGTRTGRNCSCRVAGPTMNAITTNGTSSTSPPTMSPYRT